MDLLSDILTYIRRIIKSPSNAVITDSLLIDYVNRFWIMDVDARLQLFDLKTKYQFMTRPGFDRYNMPLYSVQASSDGSEQISYYPMYQGFLGPAYINGIQVPFSTEKNWFRNIWPDIVQNMPAVATGNGSNGPYSFTFPITPNNSMPLQAPFQYIIRGHVDIGGIISQGGNYSPTTLLDPIFGTTFNDDVPVANTFPAVYITSTGTDGSSIVVSDSGQFLTSAAGGQNFGMLMQPGNGPAGNLALAGGYSTTINTINYLTGQVNVTFPQAIPSGVSIAATCFQFQCGLPRGILFFDNILTLRSPPDTQYLVEMDAYLSPAAYLSTGNPIQFAYMCEYIARGAARKILADTGDVEQFQFYEPLFREQEILVWKRSQRQFTTTRTQTIYSQGINQGQSNFTTLGGSIT